MRSLAQNVRAILMNDPAWLGAFAFSKMDPTRVAVTRKLPFDSSYYRGDGLLWGPDEHSATLSWLDRHYFVDKARIEWVEAGAIGAAVGRKFSPVEAYLDGLVWDGTPRLDSWLTACCGAEDSEYTRFVAKSFAIGAVARARLPGSKVDTVPILIGAQGASKGRLIKALAVKPEWHSCSPVDAGSRDGALALRGKWIVEIAELEMGGSQEQQKAFITTEVDNVRPLYGRDDVSFPRASVFIATSNDAQPLSDPTGGRRWLPVQCSSRVFDVDWMVKHRAQLWAEASQRHSAGERWWVTPTELMFGVAAEVQAEAHVADEWDEILRPVFAPGREPTTAEVYERLGIPPERQSWHAAARLNASAKRLGFERSRVKVSGGTRAVRFVRKL
jgi:putative DNA primase/helicase